MIEEKNIENAKKLWTKLFEIRSMKPVFKKNGKSFNYNYVTEDELLASVMAGMETKKVFLYPKIVPDSTKVTHFTYEKHKVVKDKPITETVVEKLVEANTVMTWVDIETGFELEVPWIIVGQQDDSSKAFGSAITYANRYFLLKFFGFATTKDDPDAWLKKNESYQQEIELKAIIEDIDSLVQECKTKENTIGFTKVLKENVGITFKGEPSANYKLIKNVNTAKKTYNALKKYFENEGDK